MIANGRPSWTIMSSMGDLTYRVALLFNGRFSFFWVDSWINLRCRLWTIRLDELEMDYFPLLYHQLWSKVDEEGYFAINDIRLNTTAGIVLSNFIVSLSPNLLLSYALNYEL